MFKNDFEEFSHVFAYDPITGELCWKNTPSLKRQNGKVAGYVSTNDGYITIMYKGRNYKAHRIVWLITTGEWPEGDLDHIDHNRTNNKMANLRDVNAVANGRNMSIGERNTSGAIGVCWHKAASKWYVYINVGGKQKSLGLHKTMEEAVLARKAANIKYGSHENHGKST